MQDDPSDGTWMTYGQLAEARGISRTSAQRLARRRKWRRQTDNRGITRVWVSALDAEPTPLPDAPPTDDRGSGINRALDMLTSQTSRAHRARMASRNAELPCPVSRFG